jgi:(p)ppGpp synthase/HD superfamily hydrolase
MSALLVTPSDLCSEANGFLTDAYHGVSVRPGKGPPHAQAVAAVLRRAGSDERTQVVGLLHDVVEDTPRTIDELREHFGEPIAGMVDALTEDAAIKRYAQRKRALRNGIAAAGSPVVDVAIADKIVSLHHAARTAIPVSERTLRHYHAMLQLAAAAGFATGLCRQLEDLLRTLAPAEP